MKKKQEEKYDLEDLDEDKSSDTASSLKDPRHRTELASIDDASSFLASNKCPKDLTPEGSLVDRILLDDINVT